MALHLLDDITPEKGLLHTINHLDLIIYESDYD